MTSPRLALLTYSTKPRGGVVHTLALAEALVRQGMSVDVWTLGRAGDAAFFRPVDPAVGIRVVPFPTVDDETVGMRIRRSIALLREAFSPADYALVHAQDCISANAVDRCIRTIHHLDHFSTPELVECHERAIIRPYAHLCVSQAVAREVRQGWGISPKVILNGVDADRFARAAEPDGAPDRAQWQQRFGRYVLAVGGIEPRKGSLDLLEAFALLRAGQPDLELVFAGGETLFDYRDYRATFERRAAELGVQPQILGTVDHAALPSLVAAAGVLSFVSTKEGFGLAAMEALAAGTPVVARDLPVLHEVFGDTVRYAADPAGIADQLGRALDRGPDAATGRDQDRAAAGRALATAHSWDTAATLHREFYAGLPS